MNTARKFEENNADVIDFNAYRVRKGLVEPETSHQDRTAVSPNAPVLVWWPVWVVVPQQTLPTIQ